MAVSDDGEARVQRLAEEQYLSLVRCDRPGVIDYGGYRLVEPITGAPMVAIGLTRRPCHSLAELEHELTSGRAAGALHRCQKLFAQAAKHGLMLEPRQIGRRWIWNAREVCGMPVAGDMSYRELRAFLDGYEDRPVAVASGTEAVVGGVGEAAPDFSLTAC
jgi:hypothetical protein